MDATLVSLNEARREIVASQEWDELSKEVMLLLDEYHPKRVEISEHLLEDVSERLKYSDAYRELCMIASSSLAQHFVSSLHSRQHRFTRQASESGFEKESSQNACSYLLRGNHSLKHCLKAAFNHPLPTALRRATWRAVFIKHPMSQTEKEAVQHNLNRLAHLKLEKQMIGKKLSNLLAEYLATLSAIGHMVGVLKTVGLYWKQQNDGLISNRDLLLMIPFVKAWSESGKMESEGGVVEIAEVFTAFLRNIPATMQQTKSEVQQKAIEGLCLKVSKLLRANDAKLYRHLEQFFIASNQTSKASPVYKNLADILHSSVQNMLVGDLPMDVVCYIWDQCFIGHAVQHFQCLHYFITVWLTILRDDLMACKTNGDFCEVLKRNSGKITISQFQREIDKSYLQMISTELQITPFKMCRPDEAKGKSSLLLSCSSTPQERPYSQPTVTESSVKNKEQILDEEKEHLRLEVGNLQRELAKQHRTLNIRVEKEKCRCKQEVQMLHQEIAMLRKKVGKKRSPTPWSAQGPRRAHTPSLSTSQTPNSTPRVASGLLSPRTASAMSSSLSSELQSLLPRSLNQTEDSFTSSTTSVYSSDRATYNASTLPSTSQSTDRSMQAPSSRFSVLSSNTKTLSRRTAESREEPSLYASSQSEHRSAVKLSLEDVQEIWMRIFRKFSDGYYLLCHGVQEEHLPKEPTTPSSTQELGVHVSTVNVQGES